MIFSSQACHSGCLEVHLRANHEVRRLVGLPMGQTRPRNAHLGTVAIFSISMERVHPDIRLEESMRVSLTVRNSVFCGVVECAHFHVIRKSSVPVVCDMCEERPIRQAFFMNT